MHALACSTETPSGSRLVRVGSPINVFTRIHRINIGGRASYSVRFLIMIFIVLDRGHFIGTTAFSRLRQLQTQKVTLVYLVCSRRLAIVAAQLGCMIFLPRQVKTMVMSYDDDNNSILDNAAMNWNADVFGAVVSGIEKDLSPQEVRTNHYLE